MPKLFRSLLGLPRYLELGVLYKASWHQLEGSAWLPFIAHDISLNCRDSLGHECGHCVMTELAIQKNGST